MIQMDEALFQILRVGHDTSMRGAGLSMREALQKCHYIQLRNSFGPEDLLPLIRADRSLVTQWIMYSEDKRTSGGWYLIESTREVGTFGPPPESFTFRSIDEAVAQYVVRELDFWSTLSQDESGDTGV
jgi:hypothetical protein